jgi:outer membrane murein-binding lipoprotein Lpp
MYIHLSMESILIVTSFFIIAIVIAGCINEYRLNKLIDKVNKVIDKVERIQRGKNK